jgi:DNA repair protein RecN (Recombination protein N)
MPGSVFSIVLSPSEPTAHGLEQIQFFISTNTGQPPLPLAKIVSGGELSRVSLCIHVITASSYNTPIVVFDEVDIGVSGATAEEIGRLLKKLSLSSQIICITHLPQIAALGQQHWHVRKYTDHKTSYSQIELLNHEQRIEALAQMTSGSTISTAAKEHARLLLEQA